jgi:DNA polymerase (family 10)
LDNPTIARIFDEIADLLEIKAANPFRIRAYRNAADTVVNSAVKVAELPEAGLLKLPGIGKDLAEKIREIAETGDATYHRELLDEFPPTLLDLLRLQGVGAKTVALLYSQLNIRTVEDLEQAARSGGLTALRGMGPKKQQLILKALEERRQHAGRHLLADAHDVADALVAHLRASEPGAEVVPVGSLRRGCETCGDLDVLAIGATAAVMSTLVAYPLVERVLGQGDTKSSVLLRGGFQADLRLVPAASRGAALQYFTGSKAHNIALRDRAIARGLKLNEYGLYPANSPTPIAGDTEDGIYHALGLAYVPPPLRENRGEVEAAALDALPRLVGLADIRGDLHCHTTETDGRDDIETMAGAARRAGLSYLAITDHSKALAMANGLDEHRALAHAARIREIGRRLDGITLLAGIECDIRSDGTLDLADDCLAQLDVVVASVHSAFNLDEQQMTDRLLKAMECPYVDIIGHPTGRRILKREPYPMNLELIVETAARLGVALEISCQVERLDLSDSNARLARDRGVPLVINTDAHSKNGFGTLKWGVLMAQRAWLRPEDVLNTLPPDRLRASLRRARHRA